VRITRMAVIVSAAALSLAGLTACGGDSDEKSNAGTEAKALADETVALVKQAGHLKMVGGGDDEGTKTEMDVCVRKGADLKGTMKQDGAPVELIQVGNDSYMKADPAYWVKFMGGEGVPASNADAVVQALTGKYMKSSGGEGDDSSNMSDFFDGSTDGVTKGETVKIDGKKLIPLSKKQKDGKDTTTLYVPEKGKPFPVLVKVDGESKMEIKLSQGKGTCEPTVPPADQIVDAEALSKLENA
jgi:hypothetical protein